VKSVRISVSSAAHCGRAITKAATAAESGDQYPRWKIGSTARDRISSNQHCVVSLKCVR